MGLSIDLERLLEVAKMTGALHGNGPMPNLATAGKEANLTLSTSPGFFGPNGGLFSPCGSNDLLSLTIDDDAFLTWLNFVPNNDINQFVKLLTYVGPTGTSYGNPASAAVAACADGVSVEFGTCEVLLPDKGRLKITSPTRDLTENNRKLCTTFPLFMKDGVTIADEIQWSLTMSGIAMKQELRRFIISGNSAVTGEFAGLNELVNTGYKNVHNGQRCSAMDSQVINWANHPMNYEDSNGFDMVDWLIDVVRRIKTRASWSNMGGIAVGDQVLLMPSYLRDCLLDVFTCWSVCPGGAYNPVNLGTMEARAYRNTLNGGTYGQGQIFIDGQPIPVMTYDWNDMGQHTGYFTGDIFVLTRKIGNLPVLWGQYIDMAAPAARFAEEAGYAHYKSLDGGRYLGWWKTENECTNSTILFRPNLHLSAPWAQARIQNVACARPLAPISPNPASHYYAEQYLGPAFSPNEYWISGIS
jgi:hypothetical protein